MESVRRRGGQVEVHSSPGVGTRFRLRLPLTVAIVRALLVGADGELYALPLTAVQETVQLRPEARHDMNGAGVVRWRGALLPLLDVGVAFGTAPAPRESGYTVVIEAEGKRRGLVVDRSPASATSWSSRSTRSPARRTGLAGCTILGDGRVVLILDPTGLGRRCRRSSSRRHERRDEGRGAARATRRREGRGRGERARAPAVAAARRPRAAVRRQPAGEPPRGRGGARRSGRPGSPAASTASSSACRWPRCRRSCASARSPACRTRRSRCAGSPTCAATCSPVVDLRLRLGLTAVEPGPRAASWWCSRAAG